MTSTTPQSIPANQPLAGIVVVEIGHSVAAPFAGHVLADLGATVVKIENPGGGDDARQWGPPFHEDSSFTFHALNRNKHSVAVDLKSPTAVANLRQYIEAEADVVLQNMRPGMVARLGLDGSSLRAQRPDLVYCNMFAFGARGPMKDRPGYDPLMQAFGGIMSVTGTREGPPVRVGPSLVDAGTGMWAVIGIVSALFRRTSTGEGCEIDTSLYETSLSWMNTHIASFMVTGNVPGRRGTEHATLAPYRIFKAADDYMMIACGNDNLFRRLAGVVGHAEWATDPRFATNPQRVTHRETVNAMVQEAIGSLPRAEWIGRLEEAGVPCAPMQTLDEVVAHPQTRALEILQQTEDGRLSLLGLPIAFDGTRPALRKAPPRLGEDNYILEAARKETP